jgi:hypothetical protein
MGELPDNTFVILDTPLVPHPERRKLHTKQCRWAHRPTGRERTYRPATPEEILTHARCRHCC